jgi:chromosome segregation ATPase
MTDAPIEWLERLYASNAPEADWAQDLLDRLETRIDEAEADIQELEARCSDLEREASELEESLQQAETERDQADNDLKDVLQALGASDTEEAVAMARAMREAFES